MSKDTGGPARLTKDETVALWHAIQWMEICLRQVSPDANDLPNIERERERLLTAKRALRKVNAIRKAQQSALGVKS